MKTHKVKFTENPLDFFNINSTFTTYCGLNYKKNPKVKDNLVEDFEDCTCVKCTKFFNKEMEQMDKDMQDALAEMVNMDKKDIEEKERILSIVKPKVSKQVYEDILYAIVLAEYTHSFKLVNKPKGEFQTGSEYIELDGTYVNQTTDGGMTGDEFAGTISIKITDKEYLQFSYSM